LILAGVDGARAGWLCVSVDPSGPRSARASLVERLDGVEADITVVDIPIGLTDAKRPARRVDTCARKLIGPRRSSVFTPPCREALATADYPAANAAQRAATDKGLSKQAWMIAPKIREADAVVQAVGQDHLREGHPELAFTRMNAGVPMTAWKRKPEGAQERRALLTHAGFPLARLADDLIGRRGWASDDLLDACVLAWVALRCATGEAERVPDEPEIDAFGLRMEMWA